MNKETWLHSNITSILAITVLFFTASIDIMTLFRVIAADQNVAVIVITSANNFTMMILSFYYGNSQFRTKPPMATDSTTVTQSVTETTSKGETK